jgi:hypothetical protein
MQLRNLVWATSKHDVYLMSHYSVLHWSSLTCKKTELIDLQGHVTPTEVIERYVAIFLFCFELHDVHPSALSRFCSLFTETSRKFIGRLLPDSS